MITYVFYTLNLCRFSKKSADKVVSELFGNIARKARFGSTRFWKEVVYVLQHDGEMGDGDSESLEIGDEISTSDNKVQSKKI